jgi:hypothetical protein
MLFHRDRICMSVAFFLNFNFNGSQLYESHLKDICMLIIMRYDKPIQKREEIDSIMTYIVLYLSTDAISCMKKFMLIISRIHVTIQGYTDGIRDE